MIRVALALAPLIVVPGSIDFANLPQSVFVQLVGLSLAAWWLATRRREWDALDRLGLFLIAWAVLSLAWTPDIRTGFLLVLTWVGAAGFYLCARQQWLPALAWGGLLVSIVGLAQHLGLDWPQRAFVAGATLANPNMAAQVVAMSVPFACTRKHWPMLALMLPYLYLCESEAAWAALGAAAVVGVYFSGYRKPALGVGLAGLAAGLYYVWAWPDPIRLALNAGMLDMVRDNPMGIGAGGFAASWTGDVGSSPEFGHNDWLELLATLGPGAWVLGFIAVRAAQLSNPQTARQASALAALGVLMTFSFPLERAIPVLYGAVILGSMLPHASVPMRRVWAPAFVLGIVAVLGYHQTRTVMADRLSYQSVQTIRAKDWPATANLSIRAAALDPLSARAREYMGVSLMMMGRWHIARVAFEESLRLRPNRPAPRENIDAMERMLARVRRG